MSTTTDFPTPARPIETAPSALVAEAATTARVVGTVGLFFLVLGVFAIGAHRLFTTPRMIGEGYGFIAAALGLALMLYHAARDTEPEMRRLYGAFAVGLLVLALAAGLVPGPVFGKAVATETGHNLPWAVAFSLVSLLFLTLFVRSESEEPYASLAVWILLGTGLIVTVGSVVAGALYPNFLAGPGVAVALLGLGFLCAFLGNVDSTDGLGYTVALLLGALGLVVVFAALARTVFPPVLLEGPMALKKPTGAYDAWKIMARVLGIVAFLVPVLLAWVRKAPWWMTAVLGLIGLAGAGVLTVASFTTTNTSAMEPFLIPRGVVLMGLGVAFLAISLGVCSESQFVTLARRELGAYFTSPIGYLVLLGMTIVEWFGYRDFLRSMLENAGMTQTGDVVIPEPIVRYYFVNIQPVFALLLLVPALTMRLLAEERRTGSLELLLTAPVSETTVVLSKFLATWVFFLLTWLPAGLFLIALKAENGEGFDYRPLLSFYLGLAACGAGFVAMGLFFSSLSPNQVVAAVLTFVGMAFFLGCFFEKDKAFGLGPTVQALMQRFSFVDLWRESLKGQLPLRDVIAWLSLATFWLFATIKVLEARKWK